MTCAISLRRRSALRLAAVFSGLAICLVAPAAGAQQQLAVDIYSQFTYVKKGFPLRLAAGHSIAIGLAGKPYEKLKRQPKYLSKKVLHGFLPLGNGQDRRISFVLDDLDKQTWSVWVDRNNNEDLTDDGGPIRNQGTGKMAAAFDVMIDVAGPRSVAQRPYRVWFFVNQSGGKNWPRFYAQCYYGAWIRIGAERYQAIAFESRGHDGLFKNDGLWIDLDHDGKLDKSKEHFADGAKVTFGAYTYKLKLAYP
jgi:hypothetical protein